MATLHETLQLAINAQRDVAASQESLSAISRQQKQAIVLLQQREATYTGIAVKIRDALKPGEYQFNGHVFEVTDTGVVIRQLTTPPDREINGKGR